MQGSKKWGFVWWSTGDDAGRSVRAFFDVAGCSDYVVYDEEGKEYPKRYRSKTHDQGIPKELEGYPVISNARNPYAKAASYFLDVSLGEYRGRGERGKGEELGDIKEWITELVNYDKGIRHWDKWSRIGVNPTYYIRVESLEKDIKNIPLIIENAEALEEALELHIRKDGYNERHEWLEYPEMKWQREYDENGQFMWQHFYDQELADIVYESWEPAFALQGYDKDSWK